MNLVIFFILSSQSLSPFSLFVVGISTCHPLIFHCWRNLQYWNLFSKQNKYFCHYRCGGAQVPELRVVACLCRPVLFPCPRWVLCTSLRATASRLVHKLTMPVNPIYVLFQFGCQARTPNYPLPVFSRLEKFSLFYTSFWWISAAGSSINKQGNGVPDPQLS